MNRNKIWEEIKNDTSEIYGQSVLDLFLQLTDHIEKNHFFQLNDKQRNMLNSNAIVDLLFRIDQKDESEDLEKVAELLGKKNFNKIDTNQIRYLLSQWENEENHIFKYILKYKDVGMDDLFPMLISAGDSNRLKSMLDLIGNRLDMVFSTTGRNKQQQILDSLNIAKLLTNYLNKFGTFGADEGFKMFKLFVERLGDNINKLESRHISWTPGSSAAFQLIPRGQSSHLHDYLEEILELLGPKNLDKLTGGQINTLLDTDNIEYRKRLGRALGDRLDKLSDKVISAMIFGPFDNNLDLFNAADVADSLGINRISKWLKSNEANETIDLMKEKVEKTKRNAHDWEDNFNAFMKWIRENIKSGRLVHPSLLHSGFIARPD